MVLLDQEEFHVVYDKVKERACANESEVIAFVAMDAVLDAARRTGAQAIHPGYPPASTYKLMTAISALGSGKIIPEHNKIFLSKIY